MEPMKQCPNCGKYVAADKTYCMNCGTTLGIRCPDCRRVLDTGTKVCPDCGHSFVRKTVRKKKKSVFSRIFPVINRNVIPILAVFVIFAALASFILAACPAVRLTVETTVNKQTVTDTHTLSGYETIGYFLGSHPEAADYFVESKTFAQSSVGLRFSLYGTGVCCLAVLICVTIAVYDFWYRVKKTGKKTGRRLLLLSGIGFAFSIAGLVLSVVETNMLSECAGLAWPTVEATKKAAAYTPWSVGTPVPVLATVFNGLYFAAAAYAYFAVLSKEKIADEWGLWQEIKAPFLALSGRISRKKREKKAAKDGIDERSLICTKYFPRYLILWVVALFFTQSLLSKVSNIFFWFIFLLPLVLLVYVLIARHSLQVSMISASETTEKNMPYTYEFRIDNRSIFAYPFVEALVTLPQSNSVRCSDRSMWLALTPFNGYHIKNTVSFRFRGSYDIGVRALYVYDFFRIFRVSVPVSYITTIHVLPRRLSPEDIPAASISDASTRTVKSPLAVDKLEVSDIREYRSGDSLKSIHWKLSSKSEEFIVRDYNTGTSNQTVIYCDLRKAFPDEPPEQAPAVPVPEASEKSAKRKKKRRSARSARKKQLAAQMRQRARAGAEETPETRDLTDEELEARLNQRASIAGSDRHEPETGNADATQTPGNGNKTPEPDSNDVRKLADKSYYEDMNEYLADGVVELAVANVQSELNMGRTVTLAWFDKRSEGGLYAFTMRTPDEFDRIFDLFGTAPICDESRFVTDLTALTADVEGIKQIFIVPDLDAPQLSRLTNLPGVTDAANFGSGEVLLYNPEQRYMFARERAAYLEGCGSQLGGLGLELIVVRQLQKVETRSQTPRDQQQYKPEGGTADAG